MADGYNFTNFPALSDQFRSNTSDTGINGTVIDPGGGGPAPFIPVYLYITVTCLNLAIFIVGVAGNILVVVAVVYVKEMRTATNIFLLSLSVADVLVLIVCQPAALAEFFGKQRWFIGEIMCKLVPPMENGALHVSILTMLAVTAERYNAICHPFKRRLAACSVSTTIKAVVGIWLLAGISSLPFLVMTQLEDARFYDGTPIKVCRTKIDVTWKYCYTIFVFVVFFVMPFFALLVTYTRIIRQLLSESLGTLTQNDPSARNTLRMRKQVVRMLVFIVVLFFVSLFPMRVVTLWLIFTPTNDVSKIGVEAYLNIVAWARIFMYVNSAGNPIIYSLASTKFKMAFRRVVRRCQPNTSYNLSYNSTRWRSNRTSRHETNPRRHRLEMIEEENDNNSHGKAPCLVVRLMFYPEP